MSRPSQERRAAASGSSSSSVSSAAETLSVCVTRANVMRSRCVSFNVWRSSVPQFFEGQAR